MGELARSDIVKLLIEAHLQRDTSLFTNAVRELLDDEKRKHNTVFAREIEKLMTNKGSNQFSKSDLLALKSFSGELPRDKERNTVLVEVKEPTRDLDSLVLSPNTKEKLLRIIRENRGADLIRSYGLRPSRKLLFCGPPGTGKTVSAEVLAKELYLPLVLVRFDAVVSSYLGETAANLRKVFDFARSRPMVMLFDEFDAVGKSRANEEEHGELKRVVNSFLQMMDGFQSEAITVAATNHQGLLDPALWRRFDEIIYFDTPDVIQIEILLERNLRQFLDPKSIHLGDAARLLQGMCHSDIERLSIDLIKDTILENQNLVNQRGLLNSIARQKDRVSITQGQTKKNKPSASPSAKKRKDR